MSERARQQGDEADVADRGTGATVEPLVAGEARAAAGSRRRSNRRRPGRARGVCGAADRFRRRCDRRRLRACDAIQQLVRPVSDATLRDEVLFAVFMVPIWVLMMGANNLFLARAVSRFEEELRRLLVSGLMATGFLVGVLFLAKYEELSRLWVALLFVCVTSSLVASRLFARHVFNKLRRDGRIRRPVIIVGTGSEAVSLLHATQRRPDLGYEVLGFTGDRLGGAGGAVLGSIDDTPEVIRRTGAIGAILSVASLDPAVVNRLTRTLTDAGCHVTLSSSLHDIDISRTRSQSIDGRLMIYVEPTNRSRTHLFLKRVVRCRRGRSGACC
jgi:FlaA1/EpsC-like NDP-sugar epimerase